MKRILTVILFAALPALVAAQVGKYVEVTKDYVPTVAKAEKLPVVPDMADTVALRPDIDYTITPLSMTTHLTTQPIRPATVTYWEFNRPAPFYLKAGLGAPLNTLLDFYGSTQHPDTGYLLGYVNHRGRFGKLTNKFDYPARARELQNRIGLAAGKYLGRHILEGEFSYDNRFYYRRYDDYGKQAQKQEWSYGDFGVHVRIGDDFTDLSRLNFNVALRGLLFTGFEHPDSFLDVPRTKSTQTHLGVDGALARSFGPHTLRLNLTYEHGSGARDIADYRQDILKAGLRYGIKGGVVALEAGADYWYDERAGRDTKHYVVPAVGLRIHLNTKAFSPFFEADGDLRDNSPRTLSYLNPYLSHIRSSGNESTVDYNFRLGAEGSVSGGRFAYRFFGEVSVVKNHISWFFLQNYLQPLMADQTIGSLHAELEYKPVSRLSIGVGVHGCSYDDKAFFENKPIKSGMPKFKASAQVRYTAPKISFGVKVDMQGRREWSFIPVPEEIYALMIRPIAPFAADISADVDWRVTQSLSIFGEVHNIANMKIYDYPFYRDYGINFTAGIKLVF